jgi:alkylation response protein AidB-like acyl-CoA dehydrogenase
VANEGTPTVESFLSEAEAWLEERRPRRSNTATTWGCGTLDVALFKNLSEVEERRQLEEARAWQREKSSAGYGSISWAPEYGGAGLSRAHESGFRRLERQFEVPAGHEALLISMDIEAPTIAALGNAEQRALHVASLRRADEICCQLFSEPGAGSDLGGISTRAERDGDGWVVNGQKVWTTGAQFADYGYLIARSDPHAPRREALSAFLVPMSTPGIEVRPLRQMSGGSSFNEVFLTDVRIPDSGRLGDIGGGWNAMMTTLAFERTAGAGGASFSSVAAFDWLVALASQLGRNQDGRIRQALARAYISMRIRSLTNARAAQSRATGAPGPEGSLGKLAFSQALTELADVAAEILGARLTADSGEWGTYAWADLLLGAPGMRIAGGSDEIQRNTIAERVLGLPRQPVKEGS